MRKFENWTVAYRRRMDGKTLLNDTERPFSVVRNTWRYWCADPHVIEHSGNTYVFAELYDRVLRQGVIGCCELTEFGPTAWKVVLRMPWHLSYPHLLVQDGAVYMIPESYVANEIALYKAVEFPYQWEKTTVLKGQFCAVDSTVFAYGGELWMLTLQFINDHERLVLYRCNGERLSRGLCAAQDDPNKRPGGHFFKVGEELYRPAQDCTQSYGCALNLYKIEQVSEDNYLEKLIRKIRPDELHSNLPRRAEGIHTYNFSEHYEVIDLKGYEVDPLFYVMRPIWFIWRRLKRVFRKISL